MAQSAAPSTRWVSSAMLSAGVLERSERDRASAQSGAVDPHASHGRQDLHDGRLVKVGAGGVGRGRDKEPCRARHPHRIVKRGL